MHPSIVISGYACYLLWTYAASWYNPRIYLEPPQAYPERGDKRR